MRLLDLIRYAAFLTFVASAAVALAAWAVRSGRVDPFSAAGRTLRRLTDPIVEPVERWLVRRGGNPQNAGWWIFGFALGGGIVAVSVAGWLASQLAVASGFATGGRGALKLLIYYAGQLVLLALIVRVFASWFGAFRHTPWMRPVYFLTDWVTEPLRKVVPPIGMFDVSPLLAWVAIQIVLRWLMTTL